MRGEEKRPTPQPPPCREGEEETRSLALAVRYLLLPSLQGGVGGGSAFLPLPAGGRG